eukprot:11238617-Alexandrium_andersonii.AAC.1
MCIRDRVPAVSSCFERFPALPLGEGVGLPPPDPPEKRLRRLVLGGGGAPPERVRRKMLETAEN